MSTGEFTYPGQQAGDGAQERAQEYAGQAQEKAEQLGGQAQEKAQQLGGQAQEKAQEAADQARGKLREQLDQRSSQVARQINEQASDLRAVSESLRQQGKDGPARAADKLAEYVGKVGGYLGEKDSEALLSDAEDLGRRQPLAAGAGALALGFAASRFLKASSSKRYSTRYPTPPRPQPPAYARSAVPFAPAPAPGAPAGSPVAPGVARSGPLPPGESGVGAPPPGPIAPLDSTPAV
jgi:uncharacterized protein YjbJ (UPF0337 family)